MSILTSPLKDFIIAGGRKIKIRTDFRIWLEFEKLLKSDISCLEKLCEVLALCIVPGEKLPEDAGELLHGLLEFYAPGGKSKGKQKKSEKNVFSSEEDAGYILASFRSVYGIDLLSSSMHWHEFLTLMSALPENCCLMQIVRIRQTDISEVPEKERRKFSDLKNRYALSGNCDVGDILSEVF